MKSISQFVLLFLICPAFAMASTYNPMPDEPSVVFEEEEFSGPSRKGGSGEAGRKGGSGEVKSDMQSSTSDIYAEFKNNNAELNLKGLGEIGYFNGYCHDTISEGPSRSSSLYVAEDNTAELWLDKLFLKRPTGEVSLVPPPDESSSDLAYRFSRLAWSNAEQALCANALSTSAEKLKGCLRVSIEGMIAIEIRADSDPIRHCVFRSIDLSTPKSN